MSFKISGVMKSIFGSNDFLPIPIYFSYLIALFRRSRLLFPKYELIENRPATFNFGFLRISSRFSAILTGLNLMCDRSIENDNIYVKTAKISTKENIIR